MLLQDGDEHQVPSDWHAPFKRIVDAFLLGDFQLLHHRVERVEQIDSATAKFIVDSIAAYGATLAPLSAATWQRSIYRWMDGYWQFLVDLTTSDEEVSDLTLHAKLYDAPTPYLVTDSVHLP